MKHYEVTFIVDPVLSGDEIKATENVYVELLKNEGCSIVHIDSMGLKQMAYVINKKSSGIYYTVEFTAETGAVLLKLELALRRDERIMRFLTIALDKYGVKYNEDKRAGLIGKVKKKVKVKKEDEVAGGDAKANDKRSGGHRSFDQKPAAPEPEPTPEPAPASVEEVVAVESVETTVTNETGE